MKNILQKFYIKEMKIQLANIRLHLCKIILFFFVLTFYTSLLNAHTIENKDISAFDVLNEQFQELQKDYDNLLELKDYEDEDLILEQRSLSEKGITYNAATINVVDVFTSKEKQITVYKDTPYEFLDNVKIKLYTCWKEEENRYNPISKALLTVYKSDDNNQSKIFNGWAFSSNPSIALPSYENYYFYLISCIKNK